jgi:hypothetical protein
VRQIFLRSSVSAIPLGLDESRKCSKNIFDWRSPLAAWACPHDCRLPERRCGDGVRGIWEMKYGGTLQF